MPLYKFALAIMNVEELRAYCLGKPAVTEGFPFGETTLVFKVMDKMYALMAIDANPLSINLKCDPEKAIEYREQYPAVKPGYHMNKQHWNTVYIDGSVSDELIYQWVDDSYNLIVEKLPKAKKDKLTQS